MNRRNLCSLLLAAAAAPAALAQAGPGYTATEIKLGQTVAYSGPASAYSGLGRIFKAYLDQVNERGGINGRKVTLLSLDDGYSPPKTVEVTRMLVEKEGVLAMVGGMGTPTQTAVQKYLNQRKVPQLFVPIGSEAFYDPQASPWSVGLSIPQRLEGKTLGQFVRRTKPAAKIAILSQNDDFGRAFVRGVKEGLGDKAQIVKELTYESTDPTVDSQVLAAQASGADVFFNLALGKAATQAIRKAGSSGWTPLQLIPQVSTGIRTFLQPAGLDAASGLVSISWLKDTEDAGTPDKEVAEYLAFMKKRLATDDPHDTGHKAAYNTVVLVEQVLRRAGNDLSRENVLRQATALKDVSLPLLLPPLTVTLTPTNYMPFDSVRLQRFDGKAWILVPEVK